MRRAVSGAYNIQYAVKVQLRAGHARRGCVLVYYTTPIDPSGTVWILATTVRAS